jgi:hypothetical protein
MTREAHKVNRRDAEKIIVVGFSALLDRIAGSSCKILE